MNRRLAIVFTAIGGLMGLAQAQPPVPERAHLRGDSDATRKRLVDAAQKLAAGKAADAVDDLQRVLEESADDLVTADGNVYRPARWEAHALLAKLPPQALATYRDRIDGPARKLLEQAKRDHKPGPVWALLDRYFVSTPAEEGLRWLGDWLFERGDLRTAEIVWRRLLPEAKPDVAYPTPGPANEAGVRARLVLAAIFQGDRERAKEGLDELKAKHPGAAGAFAGGNGPYAEVLQGFLDKPPSFASDPRVPRSWPTFAGGPTRDGLVTGRLPRFWASRPTWVATLPITNRTLPPGRSPFGQPVIADGRAFVADGAHVHSIELFTGLLETFPLEPAGLADSLPRASATLTAAEGRLYARAGAASARAESSLVCLSDRNESLKVQWRVKPPTAEGKGPAVWEGAPLVAERRLWAALARFEGGRVIHAVACYDPADADETPNGPAWVTELCDGAVSPTAELRTRQELLTKAGRNVVFCSHAGAVVAVDAVSGRKAWAFRYPRSAKRIAGSSSSDPAPAVCQAGRVFVAPADADRVFALDAETGQLLWESGPCDGAHILGISQDRVIVTVTGGSRGIRGLGVRTGSHREPEGWVQQRAGIPVGFGQGFVTEDAIAWPTKAGLFLLHPATGEPLGPPLRPFREARDTFTPAASLGHLAFADGCLVVVAPAMIDGNLRDQVWVYVSEARRYDLKSPNGAPPEPAVKPAGGPRAQFERQVDEAEARLATGRTEEARSLLDRTAHGPFPASWRAWAAARNSQLGNGARDGEPLPADIRHEWIVPPDGVPRSLGEFLKSPTEPEPAPVSRKVPRPPPEVVPGLSPSATITHDVNLPAGSAPLLVLPGPTEPPRVIVVAREAELRAFRGDTGEATTHDAPEAFSHFGDRPTGFVAAGPFAVSLYGPSRQPDWTFRMPDTGPLPEARAASRAFSGVAGPPLLSSFVLAGSHLFARLGEHHLLALDLNARRVAWVRGSTGRPRYEPFGFPNRPRFQPELAADGRVVVAQVTDGTWLVLDAATGQTVRTEPGPYTPWLSAPIFTEESRLLLADGPGSVSLQNASSGRKEWTFHAPGESSLSGEPPQIRKCPSALLVAVRRNHGVDLLRLDFATGRSLWPAGSGFLDVDRVNLAHADADASKCFVPLGNRLLAFRLADGAPAWEADLPGPGEPIDWAVKVGRAGLIVHPTEALAAGPFADTLEHLAWSFFRRPWGTRLPGLAGTLYHAWADRTFPVVLLDPSTGRRLKQWDIPARGPFATAVFDRDRALVATGDRLAWLK